MGSDEVSRVFVAYPSEPAPLKSTIGNAVSELSRERFKLSVVPWEELDIPGRFIHDEVMEEIDEAEFAILSGDSGPTIQPV